MSCDQMGRRSRFKRTPTGKRIFLTDRDLEVLRLLYRYRYLRATQLVAFIRPKSEKRFIERLGDLYHEIGLIDRPAAQWRRFDARYAPLVYELSGKGFRHLEAQGPLPNRTVTFSGANRAANAPQFDHTMMIVDFLVEVEIAVKAKLGQRFVAVDEILTRAPQTIRQAKRPLAIQVTIGPNSYLPSLTTPVTTHVVPDALYGIEYDINGEKRYRFYALECENRSPLRRSATRPSSLAWKMAAYDALIHSLRFRDEWGIPCLELRVAGRRGIS